MILSRATTQKITASLALLAVLLLFVAPIISTSRAEMSAMHASHPTAVSGSNAAHAHTAMGHHEGMQEHRLMPESGLACGYCDLLIHMPLMIWVFIPFIWLTALLAQAPPIVPILSPAPCPSYSVHYPRAPPFFGQ